MALVSSSHRRLSGAPTPQQQQGQGGRGRRLFYSPLSNQQHHQQHQHFYLMNSKTNNLSSESVDDWNQQFDAFHDNFHGKMSTEELYFLVNNPD